MKNLLIAFVALLYIGCAKETPQQTKSTSPTYISQPETDILSVKWQRYNSFKDTGIFYYTSPPWQGTELIHGAAFLIGFDSIVWNPGRDDLYLQNPINSGSQTLLRNIVTVESIQNGSITLKYHITHPIYSASYFDYDTLGANNVLIWVTYE